MTNTEIVVELKQGNIDNFQILYDSTINYSTCIARKYMGSREMDIDDVIQDSYVTALKHINTLEDPVKFDKWLGRIVANKALNWKRDKLSKVYELTIDDEEAPMDFEDDRVDYNPALIADRKATSEIVNGILSLIPEAQRDVLVMFYGQQYSIKEISGIIGKSENTIKTWLKRGRENVEKHKGDFVRQGITLTGISVFVLIKSMYDTDTAMAMGAGGYALLSAGTAVAVTESSLANSAGTAVGSSGTGAIGSAVSSSIGTGSASATTASAGGAGAVTAGTATTAAHLAGGTAISKIAAGLAAAVVIGGGAYGVATVINSEPEPQIETTAAEEILETSAVPTEEYVEETTEVLIEETLAESPNAALNRMVLSEYRNLLVSDPDFKPYTNDHTKIYFGVMDIDRDGIYELAVFEDGPTNPDMDSHLLYYNEVTDSIEKLQIFWSGVNISPNHKFFTIYAHTGSITYNEYSKQNGEWVCKEELFGFDYSDDNFDEADDALYAKLDELCDQAISYVENVELNEKTIDLYLSGDGISTELSIEDSDMINSIVSNIDATVQYTDEHLESYEHSYDASADPWGQYDSKLQIESYYLNNGVVVKNRVSDDWNEVNCYHFNPDLTAGVQNGTNPEDSMLYIKTASMDLPEYEIYFHKGKIIQVDTKYESPRVYPGGQDIQKVSEEFGEELTSLLEIALPGAMGIDHDPSITTIMPNGKENISFNGNEYHIKADGHDYIIDSDTIVEELPGMEEGDTGLQAYTRFYNYPESEELGSGWGDIYDIYDVKLTGDHIDVLYRMYRYEL